MAFCTFHILPYIHRSPFLGKFRHRSLGVLSMGLGENLAAVKLAVGMMEMVALFMAAVLMAADLMAVTVLGQWFLVEHICQQMFLGHLVLQNLSIQS